MNVNKSNTMNTNKPGSSGSAGTANHISGVNNSLENFVKYQFNIRSLNPGEIFQGRVTDIRNNTITIQVDNQMVQAKFDDHVNITLGQKLNFMVKENNGNQVVIKPLIAEGFTPQDNTLYKALDTAGLPAIDKNFDAAKALFNHQMSLDKQSITTLLSKAYQFPETDMNQLALMIKNQIELTKGNIAQFQNYTNAQHQIASDMNQLLNGLPDTLNQMSQTMGSKQTLDFIYQLLGNNGIQDTTFFDKLTELSGKDENQFNQLLNSVAFQKELSENLMEQLSMKPEELTNDKWRETYHNLADKLEVLNENLTLTGGKAKDMLQTVSNMKDNLQFMRSLNENFIYTQLPLNLKNKITHSDLYVFANKKNKGNPNDSTSLLLHLDMEYLGSIEVYVKLQNHKIDARFSLPDELSVKIVTEHMEELEKILESKGFCFSSEVVQKAFGEEVDFEKDFLERDETKIEVTRYSFDMRA